MTLTVPAGSAWSPRPRPPDRPPQAPEGDRLTREEVRDKLDELREEKRKTGTVAPRDVTVRQVVEAWLASPPPEVRSVNTRDAHQNAAAPPATR